MSPHSINFPMKIFNIRKMKNSYLMMIIFENRQVDLERYSILVFPKHQTFDFMFTIKSAEQDFVLINLTIFLLTGYW